MRNYALPATYYTILYMLICLVRDITLFSNSKKSIFSVLKGCNKKFLQVAKIEGSTQAMMLNFMT